MSEQENVEIVKQGYAAFQRGDIQTILNLCSDDVEIRHPMSTAIWPWAGKRRGRTQLAEFFAGLAEVGEFERFEPQEFIAQGNKGEHQEVGKLGDYVGLKCHKAPPSSRPRL